MRSTDCRPALALTTAAILCSGCLVVSGNQLEESGTQVSQASLSQIEPGSTTEAWLLATLGQPSERTVVDDSSRHVEIFKYRHTVTKAEGGAVFLIFAGGSTKETTTVTYFELVDGTVQRYWVEG